MPVRDEAMHISWSYGGEWNCETRKLQTRGTEGFPNSKDKNDGEGISQLGGLIPEVHTEFHGDSSAIVRSHQEDSSKGGLVECIVWKGIREIEIVAVWGASAEMPRFRETLCVADGCFRSRSGSCLESNV